MGSPLDKKAAVSYGRFVNAAYAMHDADNNNLTPAPKQMPEGWDLIAWIQMSDFALGAILPQFYGFIARSQADSQSCVLSLRGTVGWIEWYDNFDQLMVPFGDLGLVAQGFDRIYSTLQVVTRTDALLGQGVRDAGSTVPMAGTFAEQVANVVRGGTAPEGLAAAKGVVQPSIVVVGHSLGAALCTLYITENATKQHIHNPAFCSFASPRVGDADFAKAFDTLALTSWRIVNAQDVVPNLPPDFLGYAHVQQLELFDSKNKVRWSPACGHSLVTYLALLDDGEQPDADCRLQAMDFEMLAEQPAMQGEKLMKPSCK